MFVSGLLADLIVQHDLLIQTGHQSVCPLRSVAGSSAWVVLLDSDTISELPVCVRPSQYDRVLRHHPPVHLFADQVPSARCRPDVDRTRIAWPTLVLHSKLPSLTLLTGLGRLGTQEHRSMCRWLHVLVSGFSSSAGCNCDRPWSSGTTSRRRTVSIALNFIGPLVRIVGKSMWSMATRLRLLWVLLGYQLQ
jgi:hypothetical protein